MKTRKKHLLSHHLAPVSTKMQRASKTARQWLSSLLQCHNSGRRLSPGTSAHSLKTYSTEIYRLIVENEQQEKVIDVAGDFVQIDPSWKEKRDVVVSLHLGYNEQERGQKHLALHQMFTQDPSLQPMYSMENRYNMMKKVLEAQGIKNVDAYLTAPDQIQPPQLTLHRKCRCRWLRSSWNCRNAKQPWQNRKP